MPADHPAETIRVELSPEFNQVVLASGNAMRIAEELAPHRTTDQIAVADSRGVLFTLAPGPVELAITIERWDKRPEQDPSTYAYSMNFRLDTIESPLRLTSITPSPSDAVLTLPETRPYSGDAYVLERGVYHDPEFEIDIRTEQWLIRIW